MRAWISAIRLRTLPLAAASILAGSAYSYSSGFFDPLIFALALITAFLLQILSNLANDYGDYSHGVDDESRVGPERAVQSGSISASSMFRAVLFTGLLAFISGCYLLYISFYPGHLTELLVFLALGILSIVGAYRYTAGPNPYGYRALGDLAVFIFFGVLGVGGTYWLFAHSSSLSVILGSLGFGFLIVSVLNLNNLRDLEADKASGKNTLAVILGSRRAKAYQGILFLFGVLSVSGSYLIGISYYLALAALFVGAIFISIFLKVMKGVGSELDPYLKQVAIGTLLLSLIPWISFLLEKYPG